MKKLLFGVLVVMNLQAQVIYQDIDCHQGMINLTIADTSNTPGIYHLYTWDMILIQGAYVEFQPDTFDITFSGIGGEMHSYDSMIVEFYDDLIIGLSIPCVQSGINEPVKDSELIRVEYFTLLWQPLADPKNLCIELITYTNKQTWRKIYKN